jgi:hypothetical protein
MPDVPDPQVLEAGRIELVTSPTGPRRWRDGIDNGCRPGRG